MFVHRFVMSAVLVLATPIAAQVPAAAGVQSASNNWESFLKYYPPRALAAREEGAVAFNVTLDSKGEVKGCEVTRSSGHPLLDEETCQIITLHAQFSPDRGLSSSQVRTSQGVIAWKLPAGGPAIAAAKSFAQGSAPEKVVCKKTLRTGSLASFERTCLTPSEWAKQSDAQKAEWEDLQGKKGSTNGN